MSSYIFPTQYANSTSQKLMKTQLKSTLQFISSKLTKSFSNLISRHVINKAQFNILKIAQAYIIIKITLARDLTKHSISFAFSVSKILTLAASFAAYGRILYQSLAKYRCITQLHNTLAFLTLHSYLTLKYF